MAKSASRTTENKTVVSSAISDVLNDGRFDRIDDLYADSFVHYRGGSPDLRGRAAFREWMEQVHAGFSDFEATEEFSIGEGEFVASRMSYSGTHDGEFMDIPATGEYVEATGITINRVVDGRIVESWPETDFLGVLQQIGAVDVPGA